MDLGISNKRVLITGASHGIGAEIAAQIQEEAFDYLDAPVMRVAAPFSPVPFSPALEKLYIPNAASIVAKVKETLEL